MSIMLYTFEWFQTGQMTWHSEPDWLQGTAQASSSQLVNYIEQWSTRDVTIAVQGLTLQVDSSCSIVISSSSDPECEAERQQQPMSDSNLPAIITGPVAGGVALIVTALIVSLVVRDIPWGKSQ